MDTPMDDAMVLQPSGPTDAVTMDDNEMVTVTEDNLAS